MYGNKTVLLFAWMYYSYICMLFYNPMPRVVDWRWSRNLANMTLDLVEQVDSFDVAIAQILLNVM